MNLKYLPVLIVVFITTLAACKKNNKTPGEGKWQETKMRRYNQDKTTGAISSDTTYKANTFGRFDYMQFYSNGTCVLSVTEQVTNAQGTVEYTYTKSDSGFLLKPAHVDPELISGVSTGYTVLNASSNTLILHGVTSYINPSVPYITISDSYYTK